MTARLAAGTTARLAAAIPLALGLLAAAPAAAEDIVWHSELTFYGDNTEFDHGPYRIGETILGGQFQTFLSIGLGPQAEVRAKGIALTPAEYQEVARDGSNRLREAGFRCAGLPPTRGSFAYTDGRIGGTEPYRPLCQPCLLHSRR